MTGYTNTLFPIRWYLEHFFLFFTMKKERNAPKERKTRAAEFFWRKIPVFAPHPSPPRVGEGSPSVISPLGRVIRPFPVEGRLGWVLIEIHWLNIVLRHVERKLGIKREYRKV